MAGRNPSEADPLAAPPVPRPATDYGAVARWGYLLIAFAFLGVGGWAAFARVDGAVLAPGVVAVESKRQVVQHLEGGIIAEIRVHEGDEVRQGQILFRMDSTQAEANDKATRAQLAVALALEARLLAERREAAAITFPPELMGNADDPAMKEAIADQTAQFRERRAAYEGQVGILESRLDQLGHEVEGLDRERQSAREQLGFIEEELVAVRALLKKGLVNKSRVLALEREKARLDGVIGRNLADAAKAQGSMGEMRMQVAQVRQKMAEDVGERLLDVRQKLADLVERARVTAEVLERSDIRAPRSGRVQNVNPRIYTVGAVVRPGDTLLEIVPLSEPLVVDAQVPVQDIDRLKAEDTVEIRFPAFHGRTTPLMMGLLKSVSRDRLVDETTHQPYFLARVAVEDADIPEALKQRLRPGMAAEVAFNTGARTVLSYFLRPLSDAMSRAFTEQ